MNTGAFEHRVAGQPLELGRLADVELQLLAEELLQAGQRKALPRPTMYSTGRRGACW